MGKYSRIYKVGEKRFRYNYKYKEIEWITKLDEEMKKDNEEWREKYGKDLWETTEDGYHIVDRIGCYLEDWKESPREMCEMWSGDIDEECAYMLSMI